MTARSYGRVFAMALPAMTMTRDPDEVLRFLRLHAPDTRQRRVVGASS